MPDKIFREWMAVTSTTAAELAVWALIFAGALVITFVWARPNGIRATVWLIGLAAVAGFLVHELDHAREFWLSGVLLGWVAWTLIMMRSRGGKAL